MVSTVGKYGWSDALGDMRKKNVKLLKIINKKFLE